MKYATLVLSRSMTMVVALGAMVAVACGGNDDSDSSDGNSAVCADSCRAAMGAQCAAEIGQPASACEQDCMAAFQQFPGCEAEIRAFLNCPALLESTGWVCDVDGVSQPSDAVCVSETMTLEGCMSQG